jgi:hypothetical protein
MLLSDRRLISLFYEPGRTAELAKREGMTTRVLKEAWQRLRHNGRLPRSRHSTEGAVPEMAGAPPSKSTDEHAFDGRPSVKDADPLLEVLRARGHAYAEDFVDASPVSPDPRSRDDEGGPG